VGVSIGSEFLAGKLTANLVILKVTNTEKCETEVIPSGIGRSPEGCLGIDVEKRNMCSHRVMRLQVSALTGLNSSINLRL
jgi:hypothetical protein